MSSKTERLNGSRPLLVALLFGAAAVLCACSEQPAPQPTPVPQATAPSIFRLIRTVQITPDANYMTGSFARIYHVPAIDRFVVTFGSKRKESGLCKGAGFAFKEYTLDMQDAVRHGRFFWFDDACEAGDAGSTVVGNDYYFLGIPLIQGQPNDWLLVKYDAVSWSTLAEASIPLAPERVFEKGDPMVAYVNGRIDVSSQYNASGDWPDLRAGAATHHHFFSTDLAPLGDRILDDYPHICGSAMIYLDGVYYFVTGTAHLGDVVLLRYGANWEFLGAKTLVRSANWSQGLVFDGARFYVSYLDNSQRVADRLPMLQNVCLAAFDRDWNLVDKAAVTSFALSDNKAPGRPWVILHGNRLYVSYDVDSLDHATGVDQKMWQAYVSVYELV
jgi:hypothetical protein